MELTRRRFLQATGVVAAGAVMDLGLAEAAWAAAPIALAGNRGAYLSWTNVKLPSNTSTALQSFGFSGSTLITCVDATSYLGELLFSKYTSPTASPTSSAYVTNSHGGSIGVVNSTIWSPGGLDGTYPGNQLVTLSLPTGLPLLPQMTWSPGLSPQLKVNADSKSVVIRSKQTTRTITRFPLPTTSAFPANNGVFTLPDKSGDGSTITDTDTNIGFAITGDWLYYAIQTTEQRTKGQISVGYYNYSTKTKSSPALTSYGFPAGQELEGMTIVGGTTLVVGANLGGGPPKKFSLYKLT